MKVEKEVPDGGWGWMIVVGTALINIVNQSLLSMFGLIFGAKLEAMAGTTGVTTVMSINVTVSNFSGLLIGPLSKYFSKRQITQIGVLLVSAGLTISTYTNSYMRVIIGYGLFTGLGLGLIASSTFLIINSYFVKNKSQAVGLAMAGTSVGQMIMPVIVAHLIQHYSYDGTILILAGLSLNGLIGSMFFHPVSQHMVVKGTASTTSSFFCLTTSKRKINNNDVESDKPTVIVEKNDAKEEEKMLPQAVQKEKLTLWQKFIKLFNFQLLLDPIFVHIMIGLSLAYTTSVSFSTFFPLFLQEDLDMTIIDASSCMAILSFVDFIGRILVPLITKRITITHRAVFIIGTFLLALSRSPRQTTLPMVLTFSAICGLSRAATVINQNLVIAEYSKNEVSSAVGLNMVSKGIFVLTIGRLLGMYKDSAHNFASCIHILDGIAIVVGISWTTEVLIKWMWGKR